MRSPHEGWTFEVPEIDDLLNVLLGVAAWTGERLEYGRLEPVTYRG
jgi:hypothetical protein